MSIGRNKYVFGVGGLCTMVIVAILFLVCNFDKENREIIKVYEKNEINNKQYGVYIEKEDETGYKLMEEDVMFPSNGYVFNEEKSYCVDENENILEELISYNNGKITITSGVTTYCYFYFDLPKPDLKLNLTTDGTTSSVPTSTKYTKSISCDTGSATYDPKYNRVVFSSVSSPANCTLNYQTDNTDYDTLIEVIQAEKTRTDANDGICSKSEYTTKSTCESNSGIWWGVYDEKATILKEDTYTNISIAGYGTTTQFSSTSYRSTSGTAVEAFEPDSVNNKWDSVLANLTTDTYYHIKMPVTETGYYQLCYTMSSGSTKNRLYVYKNTVQQTISGSLYLSANANSETTGCLELGKLTGGSDYIKVTQRAYDTIATLSFYLQMTNETEQVDAGLRYEGLQPNNHVWFNNEIWRIIGYVPTKDANGNATQLVKIIRNESIRGLSINSRGSTYVGSRMYNLLNTHYYGREDGTKSGYCYGSSSFGTTCNYESIGLNTISQNMIEPVQWAIGMQESASDVGTHYATEVGTYTTTSGGINLGLMNISDYGYSVIDDDCGRDTSLGSYNNDRIAGGCADKAWLYGRGDEWTMSPYSSTALWFVGGGGNVSHDLADRGYSTRPALYLDARVYKISGSGTMADPYIIGM